MTLPRLRILQVGDLHLPSVANAKRSIDQKDQSFSVELLNLISRQPIKVVFKKLYELLETSTIDGILFMGDLTDYGKVTGYESGANYIANALQLGQGRRHETLFTGIVPGNHDINRDLAKESLIAKFAPLKAALTKAGFDTLPVEHSVSKAISVGKTQCQIVLMNSCWGCGAREYIPEEFRESVGAAIEKALAGGDPKVIKAYYDRQFDTPAFSDTSIAELLHLTATVSSDRLLVVVAHHNLLPQRQTRIAPYTELVNAGAMRASLMETGRPILYLHGHIHTDPIEVVSMPGRDALVCISAPAAHAGFNIIEIVFTREGTPLVGHVIPWAFDQSGNLRQSPRLAVPLIGRRRRSLDDGLSQVYSHLLQARQCYWSDLVAGLGSAFSVATEERLQECIELLLADQSVTVENYECNRTSWILGAKI